MLTPPRFWRRGWQEGLDTLVMDVKVGSGAFMPTHTLSLDLAPAIVNVANGAGCKTTALLTDMNQVLASSASNAVEVRKAVRFLTCEYRNPRLLAVTLALCVECLLSGGLAKDDADARTKLWAVLDNGWCWTTARQRRCLAAWWQHNKDRPTSLSASIAICQ